MLFRSLNQEEIKRFVLNPNGGIISKCLDDSDGIPYSHEEPLGFSDEIIREMSILTGDRFENVKDFFQKSK